jgi:hypothetical protein
LYIIMQPPYKCFLLLFFHIIACSSVRAPPPPPTPTREQTRAPASWGFRTLGNVKCASESTSPPSLEANNRCIFMGAGARALGIPHVGERATASWASQAALGNARTNTSHEITSEPPPGSESRSKYISRVLGNARQRVGFLHAGECAHQHELRPPRSSIIGVLFYGIS